MIDPEKVRAYIRDRNELNVLLNNKEQFDDEEIEMFDRDIREELCFLYPALKGRIKTIPEIVLLPGIISKLMEAVAHQENRNQMSIGDDNVGQIDYSNKADKYFAIAAAYQSKMERFSSTECARSFYCDAWGTVPMASAEYEFGYVNGRN